MSISSVIKAVDVVKSIERNVFFVVVKRVDGVDVVNGIDVNNRGGGGGGSAFPKN